MSMNKAANHLHHCDQPLTSFNKATSFRTRQTFTDMEFVRYKRVTRKGTRIQWKRKNQFSETEGSGAIHRETVDCSAKTSRTGNGQGRRTMGSYLGLPQYEQS